MNSNVNIVNQIESCVACTPVQILVSPASTDPTVLAAAGTYFRKATILAFKTLAAGANTSAVKLGRSTTASQQPISIAAGASYTLEAPVGAKWDLNAWNIVIGTAGDGVVVIYS